MTIMSELSSIQIPKPSDEQAFERCNVVLWRCVLNDHSAEIYGRRGQRQYGVDIVGRRNGVADQIVGIQCKLRGADQRLTEKEVREEVRKALTFEPPLSEYFIVTTAPDDAKLQSLALELSQEVSNGREKELQISVLGWDSLQRRINRPCGSAASLRSVSHCDGRQDSGGNSTYSKRYRHSS